MAEKVTGKKPFIFKRIFRAIVRFFKDTRGEVKKVVWPSRKQVRNNFLVVCVFVVLCAALIIALDLLFGWTLQGVIGLAESVAANAASSSLPTV